jgi:hypothetical protein
VGLLCSVHLPLCFVLPWSSESVLCVFPVQTADLVLLLVLAFLPYIVCFLFFFFQQNDVLGKGGYCFA